MPARLAAASLACTLGILGLARAQPLLNDPPLTSLLKPVPLDRSRPLSGGGDLIRSRPARPGVDPPGCQRSAPSFAPAGPGPAATTGSAGAGGSGPGEYARFMGGGGAGAAPGAASPRPAPPTDATASSAQPAGAPARSQAAAAGPRSPSALPDQVGTDRPLLGGSDRPLWNDGSAEAPVARQASGGDAPASGRGALPVDRPLWALNDQPLLPPPGASPPGASQSVGSRPGVSADPVPCDAAGNPPRR